MSDNRRGCVYFNFGTGYALHLLVSIHTLRKHYDGPVTVFLKPDAHSDRLKRDVEALGVDVVYLDRLSRSFDRHRIFEASPYPTTLSLDSDIVFRGPIDALWEPLEREGVLVTRFHAPAFGIDGTPQTPREHNRKGFLDDVRPLLAPQIYERAVDRLVREGIDINIGVLGIARPRGDSFLNAWARAMEAGRDLRPPLMDEMLVNALVGEHSHHLADEKWNCPADECFRRTSLADAVAIHYFGDACGLLGRNSRRMGRNVDTWAGRIWYRTYFEMAESFDLSYWRRLDRRFDRRIDPPFANGASMTLRYWAKDIEIGIRNARDLILGRRKPPII
ncbi:MAG: hypothetical protein H6878_09545 [Rhodobiaceae bacterium]|nr:hypothetical protein [Rhodobiaceae bacterium]MCC0016502.1 hypothetical protein [Rhodobiaceae bacterium]